jgi:hypothetical protein
MKTVWDKWDKVVGVYEWMADVLADLVSAYPNYALGVFLMLALLAVL